jgi:AraC family transcriptional regulator of adaptative response/methylated-DNA-[protein]-cysteine methyltransferase
MRSLPAAREMERATLAMDGSYDGVFFAAVRTTGIFCRPSCRARRPSPEHLEFVATVREALLAGYRPCKRCRPMDAGGPPPEWVRRLVAAVDRDPSARVSDRRLRELAIDPARARRYFLKQHGMTFQAYCRGRRLGQALQQIQQGADVDDVAFGNGYESLSGFRDAFRQAFGRPPGKGRAVDCIRAASIDSPLGPLLAGASEDGLCFLDFADRRGLGAQIAALRGRLARPIVPGPSPHLDRLREELARYFRRDLREFGVPLVYPGTPFQRKVWERLRRIPYGETATYESVARDVGLPGAARAVGRANGQNPIAIVVPCHRVVAANGRLHGYGGGLWRKRALLALERDGQPA